jgi:hypothetical protein
MHVERLIRLAELLEADAANPTGLKFDLEHWGAPAEYSGVNFEGREALLEQGIALKEVSKQIVNCNTAACAVGLAVLNEAFKEEGLTGSINYNGELIPSFNGNEGWGAVRYFFDIEVPCSEQLFSADAYPAHKRKGAEAELAVAKRIRELVSDPDSITEDED